MKLEFCILDVFTDRPLRGNQLAVVLGADDLDQGLMQAIAREFNFSETTFVTRSSRSDCDWQVRIFTPVYELPMAGHPTIGTAFVLRQEGAIADRAVFELGVGPTPVEVRGDTIWMTQREADFLATQPDLAALARALRLESGDVLSDPTPQVVSTGNQFLIVRLASLDALGRASPDFGNWSPVSEVSDLGAIYCFWLRDDGGARARMFGSVPPNEDPATGSAAGPLGAYVRRYLGRGSLVIEQGVEMGRPSRIEVDASGPGPRVGGSAVMVARGQLELP